MTTTPEPITGQPTSGQPYRATATIDDTVVLGPWVEVRLEPVPDGARRIVALNHRNGYVIDLDDPATPWACRHDLVSVLEDNGFTAGRVDEHSGSQLADRRTA